jgi:hypothetical protein
MPERHAIKSREIFILEYNIVLSRIYLKHTPVHRYDRAHDL